MFPFLIFPVMVKGASSLAFRTGVSSATAPPTHASLQHPVGLLHDPQPGRPPLPLLAGRLRTVLSTGIVALRTKAKHPGHRTSRRSRLSSQKPSSSHNCLTPPAPSDLDPPPRGLLLEPKALSHTCSMV